MQKKYQVGIVSLSYNIPQEVVDRFLASVKEDAAPQVTYTVLITDQHAVCTVDGEEYFNRNQACNRAIERLAAECEVIICADIDVLIPPGYIDLSYKIGKKRPFSGVMRKLPEGEIIVPRRWDEWSRIEPNKGAFGPWNALSVEDWYQIGGWDETMYSWGKDRQIVRRMRAVGLWPKRYEKAPLVHVFHRRRNKDINRIEGMKEVRKRLKETVKTKYLRPLDNSQPQEVSIFSLLKNCCRTLFEYV